MINMATLSAYFEHTYTTLPPSDGQTYKADVSLPRCQLQRGRTPFRS